MTAMTGSSRLVRSGVPKLGPTLRIATENGREAARTARNSSSLTAGRLSSKSGVTYCLVASAGSLTGGPAADMMGLGDRLRRSVIGLVADVRRDRVDPGVAADDELVVELQPGRPRPDPHEPQQPAIPVGVRDVLLEDDAAPPGEHPLEVGARLRAVRLHGGGGLDRLGRVH